MPVAGAAGAQNAVGSQKRRPDPGRMHRPAGDDRYSEFTAADRRHPRGQGRSRRRDDVPHPQEIAPGYDCKPQRLTVTRSMVRKIRFSTTSPITITVNNPQNTPGISSVLRFSKMYQPLSLIHISEPTRRT